ncbi:DUF2062 domain-containing protein [Phocaeicola sp.]|uniref:DUF2062 domain-containing protein n=1 Tax=Phocaeicola sp. TaxID=2773926 RepID=UPI0023D4F2F7|nr:DUF2062 domain-containing protein [Phocaeicola sp.]MDE5678492.1 DUF2062 domain-containing protein [Phocaeicola sp.]
MNTDTTSAWPEKLKELEIVVLIPTYNNGKTLAAVIEEVCKYAGDILVVNDGSTDHTADILKQYPDIKTITHPTNKGKGAALKRGLSQAQTDGFRYAITLDSDGQHFASDIPRFVEAIEKTPDTLLVGARNLTADNMPGKNTFANKFSNFWFRLETGLKLEDTQSGYRLYPLRKMNVQGSGYTAKYEFELEAIVFAAWADVAVKNIPIHVYYPPQEERVSHFRPFRDFTRISVLNTVLVLVAFLWIAPRNLLRNLSWASCKRFFSKHILHTQESNLRITLAVMLGVFMGIVPIWGYQMLATLFLAHAFRLNKVIAVVAANISIPPLMPLLLYGSYMTGCTVLGNPPELHLGDISLENVKSVLGQYLIGSIIFAMTCSLLAGILSTAMLAICRKKRI